MRAAAQALRAIVMLSDLDDMSEVRLCIEEWATELAHEAERRDPTSTRRNLRLV